MYEIKTLIPDEFFTLSGDKPVFIINMDKNELSEINEGNIYIIENKKWVVSGITGVRRIDNTTDAFIAILVDEITPIDTSRFDNLLEGAEYNEDEHER